VCTSFDCMLTPYTAASCPWLVTTDERSSFSFVADLSAGTLLLLLKRCQLVNLTASVSHRNISCNNDVNSEQGRIQDFAIYRALQNLPASGRVVSISPAQPDLRKFHVYITELTEEWCYRLLSVLYIVGTKFPNLHKLLQAIPFHS